VRGEVVTDDRDAALRRTGCVGTAAPQELCTPLDWLHATVELLPSQVQIAERRSSAMRAMWSDLREQAPLDAGGRGL
jgi:hypothetical protein